MRRDMEPQTVSTSMVTLIKNTAPIMSFDEIKEYFITQNEGKTFTTLINQGPPLIIINMIINERIRLRQLDSNNGNPDLTNINRLVNIIKKSPAIKTRRRVPV